MNETSLHDLQWFETVFQHAPMGTALVSFKGDFLKVNPSLCNMLEYDEKELKNKTLQSLVFTHDREHSMVHIQRVLGGEKDSFTFEKRVLTKTGRVVWTLLCVSLARMSQCTPQLFIFQWMDITERKQKEATFKKTEELHHLISEHAQDMIIRTTPDGIISYASPAVQNHLGYDLEEFIGIYCYDYWHPDDLDYWIHQGDSDNRMTVYRFRHKDGHYVWQETHIKKIRNRSGNVQHVIGIVRNITERKNMELRLQETEQRHKSLLKYTPVGICAIDLSGRLIEVNPAGEEMTGYSAEEILSMTFRDLLHPESLALGEQHFENALKGELYAIELTLQHKNRSRVEIIASSSPIIVNGIITGIYVIAKDVTEQKQTEKLLLKAEKLSLVGELAAGIAHEIRNPLTSLRGFVQLFQTDDQSDDKKMYYDVMLSEIDRINEVVSELLVLAKPSNETYRLGSITEKLNNVITLFEGQANLYNVQIKRVIEEDLPLIRCQNSLKQVFINILKNSIESMPDGGELLIQAKVINDGVCLRFLDQGCGIPVDQLEKIGHPFYSTKENGNGLGLMVSQRIIQNHHGTMQIESEVGKGTVVELILPLEG